MSRFRPTCKSPRMLVHHHDDMNYFLGAFRGLSSCKKVIRIHSTVEVNCLGNLHSTSLRNQKLETVFLLLSNIIFQKNLFYPYLPGEIRSQCDECAYFSKMGWVGLRPPKRPSYARPVGHKAEDGLPADTKLLHRLPGQKI